MDFDPLELLWEGLIHEGYLVPNSMQTARRCRFGWSLFALAVSLVGLVRGHAPVLLLVVAVPAAAWAAAFGLVDLFKEWPESWLSALTVLFGAGAAFLFAMMWAS
jgi:hypothetical protein